MLFYLNKTYKLNKMKKIIVFLLLLTVSVAQAQKNQKAVALADKLSNVMEFDKDQSTLASRVNSG